MGLEKEEIEYAYTVCSILLTVKNSGITINQVEFEKKGCSICGFGGHFDRIASIFPTEAALKKTFNDDGTRR